MGWSNVRKEGCWSVAVLFAVTAVAIATPAAGQSATTTSSLEELVWLTGYWVGEDEGVRREELWLAPRGEVMFGLHRDVPASGKTFFEYLRIESGPDGVVYQASPRGRPPTPFRMAAVSERSVEFENPEHDFPQRIRYWLDAEGALHARVEGKEGDEATAEAGSGAVPTWRHDRPVARVGEACGRGRVRSRAWAWERPGRDPAGG